MSTKGDMEPKTTTPPSKPATKPVANTNKQKSGGALLGFFVFLTFLLAIGGIGAGYYVWQQLQHELQSAQVERKALEHALGTVDENPRIQKFSRSFNKKFETTSADIEKLDKNLQNISNQQQRLTSVVQETNDIVGRSQVGWMLKEVEHVLRMAQHRLLLDRDFEGALAGLAAADERLKDINDVRLIPIRKSIAAQIQTLNQFPHPDYVGLQLQLDNTIAELKTGLLKQAIDVATQEHANQAATNSNMKPETDEPFDAKKFFDISKNFIKETIVKAKAAASESVNITRGDQKIALFIEEQEKKRAYDFLRHKLLGAKYSVSTRDDSSFHQQLNAARAWLENNDEFTNRESLIKEIEGLNKYNLMPSLPNISEPSTLLAKHMDSLKDKK